MKKMQVIWQDSTSDSVLVVAKTHWALAKVYTERAKSTKWLTWSKVSTVFSGETHNTRQAAKEAIEAELGITDV